MGRLDTSDTKVGTSVNSDLSVLFGGDIGFGEHCLHHPRARQLQAKLETAGYIQTFAHLLRLIGSADIAIANLEAPLASRPDPALLGRKNDLAWSDPSKAVTALKDIGFNALSVANDHALDCGRQGLEDTLQLFQKVGLVGFGAGGSSNLAAAPVTVPILSNGVERTLVVFGALEYRERYDHSYGWYTNRGLPGVNVLSPKTLQKSVAVLREKLPSPLFIVFPHWGRSYEPISDAQRNAARQLVLAGADLVIGHGSHFAQPMELICGKPVLFGLGNCVWNTPGRYATEKVLPYSQIVKLVFSKSDEPQLRIYPIVTDNMITGYQSRPVKQNEMEEFAFYANHVCGVGVDAGAHYLQLSLGTFAT